MTLNGVMALTLRYFTEFVIDQKSTSITNRTVKFACVTKFKDVSITYF